MGSSMTNDEMEDLLNRLGMDIVNIRGDEFQCFCPAHEERTGHPDHNPSFYINSDNGAFICFSCQFKGNTNSLIAYVQNIPYEEATTWFSSADGLAKKLERAITPKSVFEEVTDITPSMMAAFTEPTEEMLKARGIRPTVAEFFGLKYDKRKDCWIIPIVDPWDKLIGWQEKGVSGRYFNNYPKGVRKSSTLFGYAQHSGGTMIVVESPLDVARLASVGIWGGVATYGALVSKDQINLMRGAENLIIAMDHDDAGRESSMRILEASHSMNFDCSFFDYSNTTAKDVGGMSKDEIYSGLQNARHSVRGLKAIL